jgi:hypothetical protein
VEIPLQIQILNHFTMIILKPPKLTSATLIFFICIMTFQSHGFEKDSQIEFHQYSFEQLCEKENAFKAKEISVFYFFDENEIQCTLTISGYANVEGMGRIPITLSATANTCDEAAAELRPSIIEMELRLYE